MSEDYFSISATSLTIAKRGAKAIYCGEKPRKNPDGSTSLSLRAPVLLLPPDMFDDEDEVLGKVCALLNENAHLFFDSAEDPRFVTPKRDPWSRLMLEAMDEAHRAMTKHPQPNYVITKIAEEAGEVVKAAVHCAEGRLPMIEVRREMVQCLAMLYRLWVEGDGVHGLHPVQGSEE